MKMGILLIFQVLLPGGKPGKFGCMSWGTWMGRRNIFDPQLCNYDLEGHWIWVKIAVGWASRWIVNQAEPEHQSEGKEPRTLTGMMRARETGRQKGSLFSLKDRVHIQIMTAQLQKLGVDQTLAGVHCLLWFILDSMSLGIFWLLSMS